MILISSVTQASTEEWISRGRELLRELYGLDASLSELEGWEDRNFLVETEAKKRFILKLTPSRTSRETIDFQAALLEYLADSPLSGKVPALIPSQSGQKVCSVRLHGQDFWVRLLSYLPGQRMADIRPHTAHLLKSLGKILGCLCLQLKKFQHPASTREMLWDLTSVDWARQRLADFEGPDRKLLEEILSGHDSLQLSNLPQGVVHNDANDYNVLVRVDSRGKATVSGLIDFGDALWTCRVAEVAVACAYAMLAKEDPGASACHLVKGYFETCQLTDQELEALPGLIQLRLALSAIHAARNRQSRPESEYLLVSEAPVWKLLREMDAGAWRLLGYRLKSACGRPLSTELLNVKTWLRENGDSAAPVMAQHLLDRASGVALDGESLPWHRPFDPPNLNSFKSHIESSLKERDSLIGVGGYGEVQLIYTGRDFEVKRQGLNRRRSLHLGMDLFAPADTPVFAPFDGVIHSFAENDRPLNYGPTIILEHRTDEETPFWLLFGHLSRDSLRPCSAGNPVRQGEEIGRLGSEKENGGWPPHLHFQIILDLLGQKGDFMGVVGPELRATFLSLCPDPNLILRLPADKLPPRRRDRTATLQQRRKLTGSNLSLSYREPLKIVRGAGQYLYDHQGQAYLDCVNNVAHVGHCHPDVVEGAARQMRVLDTNTRYLNDSFVDLAQRLTALLPEPLEVCFFVCSGSEANELAVRMARAHTGRNHAVVLEGAYHGSTSGLIELSPYKFLGPGGQGPSSRVRVLPMPDTYRGIYRGPSAGGRYAKHFERLLAEMDLEGNPPGFFIYEAAMGCGGQIFLPGDFLRPAHDLVREAGGIAIADEVQTGFGRLGQSWWAFELQGVVPDIVTLGKPMGNGYPLGAVITTREMAESFANGMEYFNTFGGNPVACAVGLTVLDVIEREALRQNATRVGAYLLSRLKDLQKAFTVIGDVRGCGLFLGIEFVSNPRDRTPAAAAADYAVERCREQGVLLSTDGPDGNVVKIKPPLTFTCDDADLLVSSLRTALSDTFLSSF